MIYSSGLLEEITAKMREHLGWLENCSMILDTIFMENVIFTIHWIFGIPRLPLFKGISWWKTGSSIISSSFSNFSTAIPVFFGHFNTLSTAGHLSQCWSLLPFRAPTRLITLALLVPRLAHLRLARARGQLRVASTGDSWTSWRIKCNVDHELNTVSY